MTIKYWRSQNGAYLGATNGTPLAGAIEVAIPPVDARATWTGTGWAEPSPRWRVLKSTLVDRMSDTELASYLALIATLPPRDRARWDAIRYVASDEPPVLAAAAALGWPPARIAELLAPDPHPDAQGEP